MEFKVQTSPSSRHEAQNLPASYLTHELRAPITSIRLGLEILQEQASDRLAADELQMLNIAVKNTSRLEGLVNDIMDYSKIMAGMMKVQKEPCDARGLINEAVDSMQATAISHGIKLVKKDCEPLLHVTAEGRRIVQVLINLISNGIKYTAAGGTVLVSEDGKRDGAVVFTVKDTGRGIPPENLDKIFDMFQSSGRIKNTEGTGLGLTLARLMVEIHGGRIWVESRLGLGSTFYFTIPTIQEVVQRKVPQPRELPAGFSPMFFMRRVGAMAAALLSLMSLALFVTGCAASDFSHFVPSDVSAGSGGQTSEPTLELLENWARAAGQEANVDSCLLLAFAAQESGLNVNVEDGDQGHSHGLFQFWDPTIAWMHDELGISGNPRDPQQAFAMAARYVAYIDQTTTPDALAYSAYVGMALPDQRNGETSPLSRIASIGAMYNGGIHMFEHRRPIRKRAAVDYGRDIERRVRLCQQGDARWKAKKIWLVQLDRSQS